MLLAEIVFPRPLPPLTYTLPTDDANRLGYRAVVPLGQEIAIGIIFHIHTDALPPNSSSKAILTIPDEQPLLNEQQCAFYKWIATYYLCSLGEVVRAGLGSMTKLLKTQIKLSKKEVTSPYNDEEKKIIEALQQKSTCSLRDIIEVTKPADGITLLQQLASKKAITLAAPLMCTSKALYVRLASRYLNNTTQTSALEKSLTQKQHRALHTYLDCIHTNSWQEGWVPRHHLLAKSISASILHTMVKRAIFLTKQMDVPSSTPPSQAPFSGKLQSDEATLARLNLLWKQKQVVLVQSSSRHSLQELHTAIIKQGVAIGKQVLYLLPTVKEILWNMEAIKAASGGSAAMYHTLCTAKQRREVWWAVATGTVKVVVGSRAAIFLPFNNLGYIIVADEEDLVYKHDLAPPRYHTRDGAIALATHHQAHVCLGSKVPSVESYYNAQQQKYAWLRLPPLKDPQLAGKVILLPHREQIGKGKRLLHPRLQQELLSVLSQGKQAIVLHSSRGYARQSYCSTCLWVARCTKCQVSLVYHTTNQQLYCHHCFATNDLPTSCPDCKSTQLHHRGPGTQQLEELLQLCLPTDRIARIDGDAIREIRAYLQVVDDFIDKKIDILISTPAIVGSLDSLSAALVAVWDAGSWLRKPNFRAYEHGMQLLAKVVGHSGRVILQTAYLPDLLLTNTIEKLQQQEYASLYNTSLLERKRFGYPPYTRLVKVVTLHTDSDVAWSAATKLQESLKEKLAISALGAQLLLNHLKNKKHGATLWCKLPKSCSLPAIKEAISSLCKRYWTHEADVKGLHGYLDVDPL